MAGDAPRAASSHSASVGSRLPVPAGVGVGFVPAHVLHRLVLGERLVAAEAVTRPAVVGGALPELWRGQPGLGAPRPPGVAPAGAVVVAARLHEPRVRTVGHRRRVDAEGGDRLGVGRALVVVGPGLGVGAHHEGGTRHQHVGRERERRPGRRPGAAVSVGVGVDEVAHQLERGEQRLVVLVLVLHDHAVDEAVGEQRIAAVEVDPVEHLERARAHRGVVVARAGGVEDVEGRPLATGVTERVVHVVEARHRRCGPCELAHQPELLEVTDVGEVPTEG